MIQRVCSDPPTAISSLAWCPSASFLLSTTWGGHMIVYEVDEGLNSQVSASLEYGAPILSGCWSPDPFVFVGDAEGNVLGWDPSSQSTTPIGKHPSGGVKHVQFISDFNAVISGSLGDLSSVLMLDPRSESMIEIPASGRVYGMDSVENSLIVASSSRRIQTFDLRKVDSVLDERYSPLRYQTRCISLLPDLSGFVVGSLDAKIAVSYFGNNKNQSGFTLNLPVSGEELFHINDICYIPVSGSNCFAVSSGDGSSYFYDLSSRNHAYSGPCFATQQAEVPVVCSACRADGQIWAQACSYDWGRGASGLNMVDFAEIHLKSVEVNDVFFSSDGDQSSRAGSSHNQSFSHNNSWEQQNRGWNGQNRHNSSSSHQGYENQNYKKNNYSNNRKWNSGGGYGGYQ